MGRPNVAGIFLVGLAGALDPALAIGDVVIDRGAASLPAGIPFRQSAIHASDGIIATPAQKAELHRQTGAAAVDMESNAVRSLATSYGVPFISVRAISDTAVQSLDPQVLGMVDAFGRPRPASIAAALIRRPALIPELRRLGMNASAAATAAAKAVRILIETHVFDLRR